MNKDTAVKSISAAVLGLFLPPAASRGRTP